MYNKELNYTQKSIINKKYFVKASQDVFEIATFGIYACTALTQHGFADMFENTRRFMDRSDSNVHSCPMVNI